MEKMELYHFHKEGNHDRFWREKSEIKIPTDFKSTTYERFLNFNNRVEMSDGELINYYQVVADFLRDGAMNQDAMISLLRLSYAISFRSNEFKRESALENFRLKDSPKLPSRLHSIYLTDEKGIDAWKGKFGNCNLTLYRVEAEGNIFKTNEQLIPQEELSYQEVYNAAYKYWHPNFKKVPDDCNEYLTQGKIKILEKINHI